MPDHDVILLGASMMGIEVLYRLRRMRGGRQLRVLVIDQQEEHPYIPLVHERLIGRLSPEESVLATRDIVEADPYAEWMTAEVSSLNNTEVELANGHRLLGDQIVVALGSSVAPPMSVEGAQHMLEPKLLPGYRDADHELRRVLDETLERGAAPRLVVVGGGISGVEMAGELAYLGVTAGRHFQRPQVTLVHAGNRLLEHLGRQASRQALHSLTRQGVDVRLSTMVTGHTQGQVSLGEEHIKCDLVFWAGGVRPAPVLKDLGLPLTRAGWIQVDPYLRATPDVIACGDAARIVDERGTWPTMQRAIECIFQGGVVAHNLIARRRGGAPKRHRLVRDFFHGVSMGADSMITYGPIAFELGDFAIWFRRFLMKQYLARY